MNICCIKFLATLVTIDPMIFVGRLQMVHCWILCAMPMIFFPTVRSKFQRCVLLYLLQLQYRTRFAGFEINDYPSEVSATDNFAILACLVFLVYIWMTYLTTLNHIMLCRLKVTTSMLILDPHISSSSILLWDHFGKSLDKK